MAVRKKSSVKKKKAVTKKSVKKIQTVTVDRRTWNFGSFVSLFGSAFLHNPDTKTKCCLGFAVNQVCRIPFEDLMLYTRPMPYLKDKFPEAFVRAAIIINDDNKISLRERETKLIELFKTYGYKLTFKNKYPKDVLSITS